MAKRRQNPLLMSIMPNPPYMVQLDHAGVGLTKGPYGSMKQAVRVFRSAVKKGATGYVVDAKSGVIIESSMRDVPQRGLPTRESHGRYYHEPNPGIVDGMLLGAGFAVGSHLARSATGIPNPPAEKLTGGSKAIIRNIVGELHVSASDKRVEQVMRYKLHPKADPKLVKKAIKYAIKVHHENQKLYYAIMGGRIHKFRNNPRRSPAASRRFPVGTRVRKIMGVPQSGIVIPRFAGPFTDGQYRQPYPHERREAVYVEWDDGTKGWIHDAFLVKGNPLTPAEKERFVMRGHKYRRAELDDRKAGHMEAAKYWEGRADEALRTGMMPNPPGWIVVDPYGVILYVSRVRRGDTTGTQALRRAGERAQHEATQSGRDIDIHFVNTRGKRVGQKLPSHFRIYSPPVYTYSPRFASEWGRNPLSTREAHDLLDHGERRAVSALLHMAEGETGFALRHYGEAIGAADAAIGWGPRKTKQEAADLYTRSRRGAMRAGHRLGTRANPLVAREADAIGERIALSATTGQEEVERGREKGGWDAITHLEGMRSTLGRIEGDRAAHLSERAARAQRGVIQSIGEGRKFFGREMAPNPGLPQDLVDAVAAIKRWGKNAAAVAYADALLYDPRATESSESVYVQLLYLKGNLATWRGPEAKQHKATIKKYIDHYKKLRRANPLAKRKSRARYKHERVRPKGQFDPRSFRTIELGKGKKGVIGCPRGQWSPRAKRCKVGTRLQTILTPKSNPRLGKRKHLLMTKAIAKKIPPLRAQEKVADPIAYVKFFSPYSGWKWYATEFDGKDTFFGLVKGFETELGYFSLSELESAMFKGFVPAVERDLYFKPTPLSQIRAGVVYNPLSEREAHEISSRSRRFRSMAPGQRAAGHANVADAMLGAADEGAYIADRYGARVPAMTNPLYAMRFRGPVERVVRDYSREEAERVARRTIPVEHLWTRPNPRLRTEPATPVEVLMERRVGRYRVQAFRWPYAKPGDPEPFVYRVLTETSPGIWQKVRAMSRADEKRFPKRAAWAGTEMVRQLRAGRKRNPQGPFVIYDWKTDKVYPSKPYRTEEEAQARAASLSAGAGKHKGKPRYSVVPKHLAPNPRRRQTKRSAKRKLKRRRVANPPEATVSRKVPIHKFKDWLAKNGTPAQQKEFQQALATYRKFHLGAEPTHITRHVLPMGKGKQRSFAVSAGKAPTSTYTPPSGSGKAGSSYEHVWKTQPDLLIAADGKALITPLKGTNKVDDWLRG